MFGLRETDVTTIREIIQKFPEVDCAIIFGSRAKGNYSAGSDVDIALKGIFLNHMVTSRISYLLNEETIMPYRFDVLDYQSISNKDLVSHIDQIGKLIYSRQPVEKLQEPKEKDIPKI